MYEDRFIDNSKLHHILIVDDDIEELKALYSTLKETEQFRSEIFTAKDGNSALGIFEKRHFDLILTDYKMPGLDGIELLNQIKNKYPDTLRMIITGQPDVDITKKAINRAEVHHFIEKPWNIEELISVVNLALKKKSALDSSSEAIVDNVQEALRLVDVAYKKLSDTALKSKTKHMIMLKFTTQAEFNKFFFKIKQMRNVGIEDIHILENKCIIKLSIYRRSYEKIR